MSQLNLIIGPAQLQDYDEEKEKEEERRRKKLFLKAFEDKFRVNEKFFLNNLFLFQFLFFYRHLCLGCDAAAMHDQTLVLNGVLCVLQSECEQRGESYWYSATASLVTRIVENIEVCTHAMM